MKQHEGQPHAISPDNVPYAPVTWENASVSGHRDSNMQRGEEGWEEVSDVDNPVPNLGEV